MMEDLAFTISMGIFLILLGAVGIAIAIGLVQLFSLII